MKLDWCFGFLYSLEIRWGIHALLKRIADHMNETTMSQ